MDYLKLINQLKLIRPKLEEAEEAKAITEAIDIIADYEKATAQAADLVQKYEVPWMPVKRQAGLYTCPVCGKRTQPGHTHCHRCGKKLTWDREAFASRDYPHLKRRSTSGAKDKT